MTGGLQIECNEDAATAHIMVHKIVGGNWREMKGRHLHGETREPVRIYDHGGPPCFCPLGPLGGAFCCWIGPVLLLQLLVVRTALTASDLCE